ncbi:DedD protein [Oceanospirillum multiglobuliferum]|uniref:SPOR domain-containing protein n=1 Tax=Oceanospirillum multiglobuliferum TaxID=64969 RepID=A0A1T4LL18_9GAMM|nr:SPOR domain-containing protein [Oceanospirillum multiglobuliferum]OPX56623.1 hypothetical protein BTE48_01605 [Oceanospirillum multiglobuliferum]SJZ55247.1 DedD protein [Oceanospirillum multiglobuliferum]
MKYGLKHRIIGAVILLSLAVIFLPIILDGGQRPALPQTTSAIPAQPPKPEIKVKIPEPIPTPAPIVKTPEREQWQAGLTENNTLAAWTLQAATFKDEANALSLRDRLRKVGLKSYVRNRQTFYVVYVGPVADPQKAEQLKARLKKELGISALMMSYDPMVDVRDKKVITQ